MSGRRDRQVRRETEHYGHVTQREEHEASEPDALFYAPTSDWLFYVAPEEAGI